MSRGDYHPELAARAERRLAATTDAELVAGIGRAAWLVYDLAELWRHSTEWHGDRSGREAYEAAAAVHAALDALPDDTPVRLAVAATKPVLRLAWPTAPPLAAAGGVAVDQLRDAAMHLPELVRHCRRLADFDPGPPWNQLLPKPSPGPWSPTPEQAAAYGLWLDLTTGLLPALEVAELHPGEIEQELHVALQAAEVGERGWGSLGRHLRATVEAVATLVDAGEPATAARLLRPALDRLGARGAAE